MNRKTVQLLLLSAMLIVATGCGALSNPEDQKTIDSAGIVFEFLPRGPAGMLQFEAGPYKGGTAVIGSDTSAYWVMDKVPYTVNDLAHANAPELDWAPAIIKYDEEFIIAAAAID